MVRAEVRKACAGFRGQRIVCALSGGMDSVVLLHCLLGISEELKLEITAAHFNHCLRGAESDGDEAFVRQLCRDWNVPLTVGRGDPGVRTGESPEEAARNLRYAFLRQQDGILATAHHADDQLETILLNLLRGTGLKGLCGMEPRRGDLIRPMLSVSREAIAEHAKCYALSYRTDHTNDEDDALRNRLRHHVLPLFKAENPALHQTVTRMTCLLRQDEAYLDDQAYRLLAAAQRETGYDRRVLLDAPEVLRKRAIRRLLTIPKPAMHHVEAIEALLRSGDGSASVQLSGGVKALRQYDCLTLEGEAPDGFEPFWLHAGETVHAGGWEITLSLTQILEKNVEFAWKYDMMEEPPAFLVRPRQTGDVLRLSGGTKSVKKLMIDKKIPARDRNHMPVFETPSGIFAVYGLGADVSRRASAGQWALVLDIKKEEYHGNEDE